MMAQKIYTKTGDKGQTSLFNGTRVNKTDKRISVLGGFDELNSFVGLLVSNLKLNNISITNKDDKEGEGIGNTIVFLEELQSEFFNIGSEIANPDLTVWSDKSGFIQRVEDKMDLMESSLNEIKGFILPGGSTTAAMSHMCRVNARKLERYYIEFLEDHSELQQNTSLGALLNRVSDYFFVLARYINKLEGIEDTLWEHD